MGAGRVAQPGTCSHSAGHLGGQSRRRLGIAGVNRAHKIQRNDHPWDKPGNAAVNESGPVCFGGVLVMQLHHNAKQVHGGIECED